MDASRSNTPGDRTYPVTVYFSVSGTLIVSPSCSAIVCALPNSSSLRFTLMVSAFGAFAAGPLTFAPFGQRVIVMTEPDLVLKPASARTLINVALPAILTDPGRTTAPNTYTTCDRNAFTST